jgi:tol-pal system protein YbgF
MEAGMRRTIGLCIGLLLWTGLAQAGTKEEYIRLQSDIVDVQNQIRLLQKSVDENGAVTKTLLTQILDLMTRTNRLAEDLKTVQSDRARANDENVEDLVNEIRSLAAKVDDQNLKIAALTKKLEATEASLEDMKSRRPKAETGPDGKPMPLPPDQLYSLAYNDYIQGNYELAIQGFLDYLANYKDSELADNAQYYIGDCYFNQGKFQDAVDAFAQVVNLFPKGDKSPAALLKSGLAFLNLSNNTAAVEQFKNVIVKYPDSPEANIAVQQLQILGVEPPVKPKKRT